MLVMFRPIQFVLSHYAKKFVLFVSLSETNFDSMMHRTVHPFGLFADCTVFFDVI